LKQLITNIISRFGGRLSAGEAERNAQLYLKSLFEKFCNKVEQQEFTVAPDAAFGSLKIFFGIYYFCLFLFWFNVPLAFAISVVNTILFVGHFVTYGWWLDPFYPKQSSLNIIGTIEPEKETKQILIISAHIDSATEFQWWFKWKKAGLILTILSGFLLPLYTIFLGVSIFAPHSYSLVYADLIYWFFILTAPMTVTLFSIHGDRVVDGANDNLSGIAVIYETGKYFSVENLKHTRLHIVSFGCEELGLKGAAAFVRQYPESLKGQTAIVNIDSIKDPSEFHIVTGETMILATHSRKLNAALKESFDATGVKVDLRKIPFGGTDAAVFSKNGFEATNITAMSFDDLDPTYHTRLDTVDTVNEQAMELCKKALVYFINDFDQKQS
jgi:hypothetical protein